MHDHLQPCRETILQKLVQDIVIVLPERLCFGGDQILDQPHLLKETDKFVNISIMVKSAYRMPGSHNMLE